MAAGERIAHDVSAPVSLLARRAVLAAAIFVSTAFFLADRARADCLSDVVNAVENTASALDSPQCQTAFAESSPLTTGLTAAFEADQNLANQVCNALSDVNSWLPAIPQDIQSELGALNPIDFATCACSMYQGIGQLPNEAVSCIQGLICGLSQLRGFGRPCKTCQQPPPLPANCTPPAECINMQIDP